MSAAVPVASNNICSHEPPQQHQQQGHKRNEEILKPEDIMEFLKGEDISELAVLTKSGTVVIARFTRMDSVDPDIFKSNLFKSMESIPAVFTKSAIVRPEPSSSRETSISTSDSGIKPSGDPPSLSTIFASRDWKNEYQPTHVDVPYTNLFQSKQDFARIPPPLATLPTLQPLVAGGPAKPPPPLKIPSSLAASVELPPKKRPGEPTDWKAMFFAQLSPLVEAAARQAPLVDTKEEPMTASHTASGFKQRGIPSLPQQSLAGLYPQDQPSISDDGDSASPSTSTAGKKNPTTSCSKSLHKRKPRKIVPDVKEFVDVYTDTDVLFGRGGRSNHHQGNKIYRDKVTEMQEHYRRDCVKNEKTKVAQTIVDFITIGCRGRFLELDKDTKRWYVVPNIMARRKVGQALRENNTEEARQAKREKYGQSKGGGGGSTASIEC
jgi:hypothetical protein